MLETAGFLSGLGIDGVKLHLLYVIRGTRLETLYNKGNFECLAQEEYAGIVCDFLERIPGNMIIQRLTGDPHPNELVAPQWALEKKQTLEMIKDILEQRDTWQGRLVDEHPTFNIERPTSNKA
jgi:radical SAM superfamily enzyme